MEKFNLNLSELTSDTLNNLSDMSFSTDSKQYNRQEGGFFGLFGQNVANKVDSAALDAAKNGDTQGILDYFISKDLITSYKKQDADGNTILHYLLMSSNPVLNLIKKIISRPDSKTFINKQNKNGDTPLLISLKYGHHDLCTYLIERGAAKSIKNKQGEYVETETPIGKSEDDFYGTDYLKMSEPATDQESILQIGKLMSLRPPKNKDSDNVTLTTISASPYKTNSSLAKSDSGPASNILQNFFKMKKQSETSDAPSLGMGATETIPGPKTEEISAFVEDFMKKESAPTEKNLDNDIASINRYLGTQLGGGCGCAGAPDNTNTEYLMNAIEDYFGNQSGGACDQNTEHMLRSIENRFINTNVVNTDSLLQTIENRFNKQSGGAGKIKGIRKIVGGNQNNKSMELARMISSQTDEIIARVIQRILNIMEENKKKFKGIPVSEEWAKTYKSALWKKVKETNPDMKNPLDVAVEMEKITDLDTLTSFKIKDIKDLAEQIEKHRKEKGEKGEKGDKDKKGKVQKPRKIKEESETSSEDAPPPVTEYSETSF